MLWNEFIIIKPQKLGSLLMKSSQSNFNLRSPSSYLARSYLIATVTCIILKLLTYWSVKPIATYAPQFVHTILLNPKVQPICLPDKPVEYPDNREGDLVTITGWGLQKKRRMRKDWSLWDAQVSVFSQK